jgi:DNA repair photolyase
MKDNYRAIYKPRGAALEYSPLAVNLYTGCPHGCKYCYVPGCLRKTPEEFHGAYTPRKNIVAMIQCDLEEMEKAQDKRTVLLCFTCDPYPGDDMVTREVLERFREFNQPFQLLTKGGMRAVRDFDLYKPGDAYAATLTACVNAVLHAGSQGLRCQMTVYRACA